jgi:hypothetical protein
VSPLISGAKWRVPIPIDDPSTWAQGIDAFKAAIENIRSAIGMVKNARSGNEQQQKAIDNALREARLKTVIAEAQLAKALGYEFCKCDYPPTPMRTVGYITSNQKNHQIGELVYECPKCGRDTAAPFGYKRITPAVKGP